jgi:hypothetical protein
MLPVDASAVAFFPACHLRDPYFHCVTCLNFSRSYFFRLGLEATIEDVQDPDALVGVSNDPRRSVADDAITVRMARSALRVRDYFSKAPGYLRQTRGFARM